MKIEISKYEANEILGGALRAYIGPLVEGREITNVEFKSYPTEHIIITMTKPEVEAP